MRYVIFLTVLVLLVATASAELIDTKTSYFPGETLIAKLGFVPLQPISQDQILLLKDGHIQIPSESAVVRLGNDYFVYSSLPLNQTNLTLRIKDVYRMSGNVQVFGDIDKNISLSGDSVPYSIIPGAIAAREPAIDLRIISYLDSMQTIYVQEDNNGTVNIAPGENKIRISTNNIPQGPSTLHIGNYQLPVYLDSKTSSQTNNSISNYSVRLEWFPRRINGVILQDRDTNFALAITNTGSQMLKDILIVYDGSVFYLPRDHISSLDINETAYLNFTIKKSRSSLDQVITAKYGNEEFDLPVTILVTSNSSSNNLINGSIYTGQYCLELNGKVCSTDEVCSGSTVKTIDQAQCCTSTCVQAKKSTSSWLGYLIGALVLIILVVVGGRYLKSKKPEDAFARRVASAERKI